MSAQDRFAAAFWAKVSKGAPDECWPWQGYKVPSGHGLTSHQCQPIGAHRKAWILTNGPIRGALCVNHRCDNKLCCNPAHMYLGTRADNMIDRWGKVPEDERKAYGRPFVLDDVQLERLVQMRGDGKTLNECAAEFGVHIATICRYITPARRERVQQLRAARLAPSQN